MNADEQIDLDSAAMQPPPILASNATVCTSPCKTVDSPSHFYDLPQITIVMKRLPEAVEAAVTAMAAHNNPPTLFYHDGGLVKLVAGHGLSPTLRVLSTVDVQGILTYAARWFDASGSESKPIFPPSLLVKMVMGTASQWAPPLRQIVGVPVFGKGYRLLDCPGYHAEDQIYYCVDHLPILPVSSQPSAPEIAEAVRLICDELLGDFPFVEPPHRAAAVAAAILPFVRDLIEGATPLHLFDSPAPGSGKTLLVDVICWPWLGRAPAATTEVANPDDLRKSITAMALSGETINFIDNINAKLRGSALAAALTKVEMIDRIVGTSRLARSSVKFTWLATGNNVQMTSELARRIVRSRIDAAVQKPHLRKGFRHSDLRAWARTNRSQLIWAILTLVQNWNALGRPDGPIVLGSYETYSKIIGGILKAASIDGFLANIEADQRHADDDAAEWEAFIAAWNESLGRNIVGADDLDKAVLSPNPEMLSITLASTGSERGRRIRLGQELRKRRDSVILGNRIRVSDKPDRHGCWRYHLEAAVPIAPASADASANRQTAK
jgi:hypothetical protein